MTETPRKSHVGRLLCCVWLIWTLATISGHSVFAEADAEPNLITFSKIDRARAFSRGQGTKVAVVDCFFDLRAAALKKYVNPTSLVPGAKIGGGEPWHGEWTALISTLYRTTLQPVSCTDLPPMVSVTS